MIALFTALASGSAAGPADAQVTLNAPTPAAGVPGAAANSAAAPAPASTPAPAPAAATAIPEPTYDASTSRALREKNSGVGTENVDDSARSGTPDPTRRQKVQKSRLTRDESEARADKRKLTLHIGEDKVVDLDFAVDPDLAKVMTVNGKLVGVRPVTLNGEIRQLVFSPLAKGETTIFIRDGATGDIKLLFDVTIEETNLVRRAAELKELLRDVEGIEIKILGSRIIVDGEVLVAQDYGRVVSVLNAATSPYKELVISLVGLSPLSLNNLSKEIRRQINAFAPNVTTRVSNGMIFLEGSVDDGTQALRAEMLAKLYLPEARPGNATAVSDPNAVVVAGGRKLIQNFILVNPPPPRKTDKLVRITVHYVELKKDYSKAIGFSWNPTFDSNGPSVAFGPNATTGQVGTSSGTFSATISNLLPKLNSANAAGFARVLKQATVIIKSGSAGTVDDQVSTPLTGLSAQGAPVNIGVVQVGMQVQLTPKVVGTSDDIEMDVTVNNSTTSGSAGSVSAKKVHTVVYVRSRESAAIGGIDAGTTSTDFNRTPADAATGASIFNLNRKKEISKAKSQFVMFVTPEILENASDGSADLRKNFRIKVK